MSEENKDKQEQAALASREEALELTGDRETLRKDKNYLEENKNKPTQEQIAAVLSALGDFKTVEKNEVIEKTNVSKKKTEEFEVKENPKVSYKKKETQEEAIRRIMAEKEQETSLRKAADVGSQVPLEQAKQKVIDKINLHAKYYPDFEKLIEVIAPDGGLGDLSIQDLVKHEKALSEAIEIRSNPGKPYGKKIGDIQKLDSPLMKKIKAIREHMDMTEKSSRSIDMSSQDLSIGEQDPYAMQYANEHYDIFAAKLATGGQIPEEEYQDMVVGN